ncbi:non-heme iron oxygenase ferredoxin subunit [Variovorax sp. JS1663]|uniref:non-heme iron oxygenase ferredoxin subunit n=1 Tax=Variovorax sp. JS1663 TaxID=1851577 RepID=UPI000B345FC7|nr:non-heme iron oxygenase ferredoxin subunit [Variovorax sp. JS1663]OUM00491.1 ferredoxin [Variovorax sp. JS1663]
MAWTRIADANQLQDEEVVPITLGSAQLALFRSAGEFHLTDNVCTHQYALLSDGYVEDGCVECPLHQARFDLRSGAALCAPATQPIRVYPVRVEGDDVLADV